VNAEELSFGSTKLIKGTIVPQESILPIIVSVSCLAIIYNAFFHKRLHSMWVLKAVLLLCGNTLSFYYPHLVYLTFVFWILLLIVPIQLVLACNRCVESEDFVWANRFARLAAILHPCEEPMILANQCRFLRVLWTKEALQTSRVLPTSLPSELQLLLEARRAALREDWEDCLSILHFRSREDSNDHHSLYLLLIAQCLGELERINELLELFQYCEEFIWKSPTNITRLRMLLLLFAYTGRPQIARRLVSTALARLHSSQKLFWQAVALDYAGQSPLAKEFLLKLRDTDCYLLRTHADRRLTRRVDVAPNPAPAIQELEADSHRMIHFLYGPNPSFPIGLLFVGIVLLTIYTTDSLNLLSLQNLLQLDTIRVLRSFELWRLLSAGFVHVDFDHFLLNSLGLGVLGFFIERRFGTLVFMALFLAGTLAACVLMTLSAFFYGHFGAIGASGGVMCMLGFSLHQCHSAAKRWGSTLAASCRRKLIIALIIQALIDMTFPNISRLGHLGGIITGLIFSLLLTSIDKSDIEPHSSECQSIDKPNYS
jgi:rhomboid protease GluP